MKNIVYYSIGVAKYGIAFMQKVVSICLNLDINPSWLMCVMKSESGISHSIINSKTNATGFIQFMPNTAKGLGTTVEKLKNMTALEQLDYVEKYFKPYKRLIHKPEDLYIVTFYPYALNKPDTYVMGSEKSPAFARLVNVQNPNFDFNKDGVITLGEFRKRIREKTFKDLPESEFEKKS